MKSPDLLREVRARLGRGRASAIPASIIAADLGISERTVGQLVAELIEQGDLIGSTCTEPFGYFLLTSWAEFEEGTRHIRSRALASLARISQLKRSAERQFDTANPTLFDEFRENWRDLIGEAS